MATLTVKPIPLNSTGEDIASDLTAAAAGGDQFALPASGLAIVVVKNVNVTSRTMTANSQKACDQGADHDLAVAVAQNEERVIKVNERFKDANGFVQLTYDSEVDVTVAVYSVL